MKWKLLYNKCGWTNENIIVQVSNFEMKIKYWNNWYDNIKIKKWIIACEFKNLQITTIYRNN